MPCSTITDTDVQTIQFTDVDNSAQISAVLSDAEIVDLEESEWDEQMKTDRSSMAAKKNENK